jgi:hypothetical protein
MKDGTMFDGYEHKTYVTCNHCGVEGELGRQFVGPHSDHRRYYCFGCAWTLKNLWFDDVPNLKRRPEHLSRESVRLLLERVKGRFERHWVAWK